MKHPPKKVRGDPRRVLARLDLDKDGKGICVPLLPVGPMEDELPEPALVLEGGMKGPRGHNNSWVRIDGSRMTAKQFLFAHEYVKELGRGAQAYENVYGPQVDRSTAYRNARALRKKPHIAALIQRILRQKGIIDRITDNWVDGVSAMKTIHYDPETKEKVQDPDWKARSDWTKTFLRMVGADKPQEERRGKYVDGHPIIDITPEEWDEEPIEVLKFIEKYNRYPSSEERRKLLKASDSDDNDGEAE